MWAELKLCLFKHNQTLILKTLSLHSRLNLICTDFWILNCDLERTTEHLFNSTTLSFCS